MSTMSQSQTRHGARRAFGIINANSTPRKVKGGASAIADEVHSAKKDKHQAGLFAMATRSSKKRAASLKEAEDKEVAAAAVESPSKNMKKSASSSGAAVLPKPSKLVLQEEAVGEEYESKSVFRTLPEVEDAAFWDEMDDLLEIKLANPIRSEDEFDFNSSDDDDDKLADLKEEEEVSGDN